MDTVQGQVTFQRFFIAISEFSRWNAESTSILVFWQAAQVALCLGRDGNVPHHCQGSIGIRLFWTAWQALGFDLLKQNFSERTLYKSVLEMPRVRLACPFSQYLQPCSASIMQLKKLILIRKVACCLVAYICPTPLFLLPFATVAVLLVVLPPTYTRQLGPGQ